MEAIIATSISLTINQTGSISEYRSKPSRGCMAPRDGIDGYWEWICLLDMAIAAISEYGGKQRDSDLPPLPFHHHHHRFIDCKGNGRERDQALAKQTEVKEEEKEIGSVWDFGYINK